MSAPTCGRRLFIRALSSFALPALTAQTGCPNLIMIFCDDLGYSDLACYGNRTIRTPNVDRLASRGVRFSQFYVTAPACSPSRTSLLTGQYSQRFGIYHGDLPELARRESLPDSAV